MATIDFKFSEGDSVTLITNPNLGEYEVNGLHCTNSSISYTINDGEEEQVKYEYQLRLARGDKTKKRKIGFKERKEQAGFKGRKGKTTIIGNTKGIELNNSDFEQ